MSFSRQFISKIYSSLPNDYRDNFDYYRFGSKSKIIQYKLSNVVYNFLSKFFIKKSIVSKLTRLLFDYADQFEDVFSNLENETSKKLMVDLLAYYVMGQRYVKLELNSQDYWDEIKKIDSVSKKADWIRGSSSSERLIFYDLRKRNIPVQIYLSTLCVLREFILKQYEYLNNGTVIKAAKGDVIIDAGACWGDTALYFANETGPAGKVYSFEFLPSNLTVLKKNLSLNPGLSKSIEVVERPLWHDSEQTVSYTGTGPGNKIVLDDSLKTETVKTLSIDDFVESNGISKIDFIKMDIEGAELPALNGAIKTLRKYRPKLAIAIYHSINDFVEIPRFIKNLDLGYKIYLDHYTIQWEETIVYATVD